MHPGEVGQVALHDLGAELTQRLGALSSRRTKARTLCPLASSILVTLRPMEPTAPAAPVTRIGLACDDCEVISGLSISSIAAESHTQSSVSGRPPGFAGVPVAV